MKIEIVKDTWVKGEPAKAGDILEVDENTSRELLAYNKAKDYVAPLKPETPKAEKTVEEAPKEEVKEESIEEATEEKPVEEKSDDLKIENREKDYIKKGRKK